MIEFLAMAREDADDASLLYEAGRYRGACSRAYYAMFNAARALLETRGYGSEMVKTHAGVLRLFSMEFVQQGPFDAEFGRPLRTAAKARHLADYDRNLITAEEAESVVRVLQPFLDAVERAIRNEIGRERLE